MKTNRGYIVAMHNKTNKIVTISLEMWDLIENINDYKPLYRGHGIVQGMIVGVVISGSKSENYQADYKVHSLDGQEPQFYFKSVAEHHIITE